MGYVYSYEYEDAGHGTSPELGAVETDAEMLDVAIAVLAWVPLEARKREAKRIVASVKREGRAEQGMEDLAEELVDDWGFAWEDVDDVDTSAVLIVERKQ